MSRIFKSGDGGTDPPASQLPTNYRVKIGVLLCLLAVCIIVGCDRNESPKGYSQEWPADPGSVVNGELPEVASMPDISEYKHPKYSLMGHFLQNEVYRQRLLCSIEQNPELSPLLDAVEGGIESFQSMIDASKGMKLGINASAIDNGDLIKLSGFKKV